MLPLNFFVEPALSVISLTPTVFTNKISVALKAIRQCSHRRTDFGHNFGSSRWTNCYFPGWSLSGSKNETSRLLTYKIFWWKKITSFKSSKRTHFRETKKLLRIFKGKDFQEKSGKVICSDNEIENQTKLSLQKISKNVQNLQEIKKNNCPHEYTHWKLT